MRITWLVIRTYEGLVGWAIHYYGDMKNGDDSADVEKRLTAREAADLNKRDGFGYKWKKGSATSRCSSEEEVIKLAREQYRQHFSDSDVLILGHHIYPSPHIILEGPEWAVEKSRALHARAEEIGRWNEDDSEMDELCEEWNELIDQLTAGEEPSPEPQPEPELSMQEITGESEEPQPEPIKVERPTKEEIFAQCKKVSFTVTAYNPMIETEDGKRGFLVFKAFCTDVTDSDGNDLGNICGGTGYVTMTVHGREDRNYVIPHDELWYALTKALEKAEGDSGEDS